MRACLSLTVLLLGCTDYRSLTPNATLPGWAQEEVSCDTPPPCDAHAASLCVCAERPGWQLVDVNQNSATVGQTFGLDSFADKVVVLSFYRVQCPFCQQQMGFLQVLHDQLASEGYDVVFLTLLKKNGDCAEFEGNQQCPDGAPRCRALQCEMGAARNSYGACRAFASPNCDGNEGSSLVTVRFPILQDTEATDAWANFHGGGNKDDIFVYRRDGRLAAFYPAAERIIFANPDEYRSLKAVLKSLTIGKVACDENAPCSEGKWCRNPEPGGCRDRGFCVAAVDRDDSDAPICPAQLYPQPVCGCDDTTYRSACAAAAAGQSIFENGHCLD